MSPETPSPRAAWHARLAGSDASVHAVVDARAVEAENAALHERLEGLMAELRIARSAVAVREAILREHDAVLREHSEALRGRDREVDALTRDLQTIQATRSWQLTRRLVELVETPRRLLRR